MFSGRLVLLFLILGSSIVTVTCTPLRKFTEADLLAIAPGTSSCTNATYTDECSIAKDAAPQLDAAFKRYNFTTVQEAAAVLAWMLNESAEFKYNECVLI
jgi:hypothetical protein